MSFLESNDEEKLDESTGIRHLRLKIFLLIFGLTFPLGYMTGYVVAQKESVRDIRDEQTIRLRMIEKVDSKLEEASDIPENFRFDCHPENGASELSCRDRGCIWSQPKKFEGFYRKSTKVPLDVPYCYYPAEWQLYKYVNGSQRGNDFTGFLKNFRESFYKKDIELLKFDASSIDEKTLRVKV